MTNSTSRSCAGLRGDNLPILCVVHNTSHVNRDQ